MNILQPESSIWYAICWSVVAVRFLSIRLRRGSWSRLQIDDYLILPAMITLTIVFVCLHIIIRTDSNLIEPNADLSTWTPEEFEERIRGSKLTILLEQMQIATIWLLKTCLLLLYTRMTELLRLHLVVKLVAVYVGVGFVVMEILWFGVWCRPFNQYWAVPPNSTQCSAMINHLITNAVLNISSDIMILAIPIPLVFKVKLPIKNKLILCGMFFLGCFTICAATINKYASFKDPFSTSWMIWYLRESFTAMICANLPLTRPVLQRIFNLGEWTQQTTLSSSRTLEGTIRLRGESASMPSELQNAVIRHSKPLPSPPRSSSQEYLNRDAGLIEIQCDTEIRIERHPAECGEHDVEAVMACRSQRMDNEVDRRSTKSRPRSLITTCYHESSTAPEELELPLPR